MIPNTDSLLVSSNRCPALPLSGAALLFALGATVGIAQTAPVARGADTAEEPIRLEPFTVRTDRDVGFVAASSLAGGRLAGDLADTPAAYSVQTREFLEALNLANMDEALGWTVNANLTPDAGGGFFFASTSESSTFRGVSSSARQRSFFAGGGSTDTYNLERLDYGRGPNAILFGTGALGGAINAVPKSAILGQRTHQLRLEYGSWNSQRVAVDATESIGKNAAGRISLLWDRAYTWRDWEMTRKKGVTPALTFNLTRSTQLKLGGEYYESAARRAMTTMFDYLSGWDGVTTYAAPQPSTLPSQARFGTSRNGDNFWVWSPASGLPLDTVMSYTGTMRTTAYIGGTTSRLVNGVAGINTTYASGQPFLEQINVPPGLFDVAFQHSNFRMPARTFTGLGPAIGNRNRYWEGTFSLDQRVGDSLFLQLSGVANKMHAYGNMTFYVNNGGADALIDVMSLLPSGQPNPNFRKVYSETRPERIWTDTTNKALRLSAAYTKDKRWVNIMLSGIGSIEQRLANTRREYYVLPLDPDSREWGMANTRANKLRFVYYWDQQYRDVPELGEIAVVNPATNATTRTTPLWINASDRPDGTSQREQVSTNLQFAGRLSFWNKRLILLGAYRVDQLDRSLTMYKAAMDQPVGTQLSPSDIAWRPNAPSDYLHLRYTPKNSTGTATGANIDAITRPRDGFGVALPQYANDRFQDDFNPPDNSTRKATKSLGGVLNLWRGWAVWANYAETFNPADFTKVTINYATPPSSVSRGFDFGLRGVWLGGRIVANLSRYEAKEDGQSVLSPNGYSQIESIILTNAIGDNSTDGRNIRGVPDIPNSGAAQYMDFQDRKTKGYELEIVGNLSRSLRLTLNGGLADAIQVNAYRDTRAYVDRHLEVFKQILNDAGVIINANNVASLDPSRTPSMDATSAGTQFNSLMQQRANWVVDAQKLNRLTRYTANVYSDYRFVSGKLKDLRVGYGMQFRGPQVIGYRGSDTIVNPANPLSTVDDPTVDAYSVVWTRAYSLATATLSYPVKLSTRHRVDFNLSISNLFDYDEVLYNSTGVRMRNGDITQPAAVTVPKQYSYLTPRSFRLSATLGF